MIKKIGFGAALWLALFIVVSAVLAVPGPALVRQLVTIAAYAALGYAAGWYYFKTTPGDLKTGAIIWVIWAAVAVILDWLVVGIAVSIRQSDATLSGAYRNWPIYVALAALIAAVAWSARYEHGQRALTTSPGKPPVNPFKPQA